jgi:hypothetical protein
MELKKRDNWEFDGEIKQREEELKLLKDDAIRMGRVVNHPTFFVEYRQFKK